jgi:hypothetical protein
MAESEYDVCGYVMCPTSAYATVRSLRSELGIVCPVRVWMPHLRQAGKAEEGA